MANILVCCVEKTPPVMTEAEYRLESQITRQKYKQHGKNRKGHCYTDKMYLLRQGAILKGSSLCFNG
jgi:hypothetical protein